LGEFTVFKFFRFTRKSDVQDVEPKVGIEPSMASLNDEPFKVQDTLVSAAATLPMPMSDTAPAEEPYSIIKESAGQAEAPQKAPVNSEPKILGQMDTLKATREDVIAAYKIFLGRLPESMEVIDPRVGVAPSAILVDFLISKEFLDQASKSQLILALAKKILDDRKLTSPSEEATLSETEPKA